ncbi:methyl-accepting chemotaxis protein [Brevibacillus fulvus]|uniref:Methyl-accepting chemotaxis protein n=1 Tax=Brevibacillus fulvus TaxID=1125967 RepID=A0A938Y1W9_9BACL|nr:methyl-accepting chemotaxis protein [Brevibacillus fulvus]MBM7591806.1 methyl-accepting chemotaxis protein [Brevibacillus fulvus]
MRLQTKSLRSKLVIFCILVLLIPTIVIGISTYQTTKSELNEAGRNQLKQNVKMVIAMITLMNQQVETGKLTLEEAQEKVRQELLGPKNADNVRPMKQEYLVGKTGYPWAVNREAISVMNPNNEGQNLIDVKTEDGVMLGKEIVSVGTSGGGFLTYKYKLPGNVNRVETKVNYVEVDPHWGWIVGCGAYYSEFNSSANLILYMVGLISVISLLAGIVIVYYFAGRFTKPILQIAQKLNVVADGDFTVEAVKVKSKDEIAELARDFNHMIENMRKFVQTVHASSRQVATSSAELRISAEQTSQATEQITISITESASGAEDQKNSLQGAMRSLEEVAIGMQHIAKSSGSISESSADTSGMAQAGGAAIEKTVEQMSSIFQSVHESDTVVKLLDQRTKEIEGMLKVISDISAQTNLLALNAAIEAARAGEHGRGFSVVADEVRKLADQSNQSTMQIAKLIEEIHGDMTKTIRTMGKVKEEVESGMDIATEAKQKFSEILLSTGQISQQIEELASLTQQMSASLQEVSRSGDEVSRIAEQASDRSQNIASAAEEQLASMEEVTALATTLANLSEELQSVLGRFKF